MINKLFMGAGLASLLFLSAAQAQQDDAAFEDLFTDTPPGEESTVMPEAEPVDGISENEPDATPPASSRNRLIEEIIVTAQKREQNLQDVPVAVAAFSAEKLDASGIKAAQDLQKITPGLTMTKIAGYNIVFLRGIGTDAFLSGADPSVPIYRDGIQMINTQGSLDSLGRVVRVEVLKGPQGTLFGRNSTGGAVNIITADPSVEQFEADLSVELGNYSTQDYKAYLNVPVFDTLAFGLSGYSIDRDSYHKNTYRELIDTYQRGGDLKLRWEPTESLNFTLWGSVSESSGVHSSATENTRVAPVLAGIIPEDPKADHVVAVDTNVGSSIETTMIAGKAEWLASRFDSKLIASRQEVDGYTGFDYDGSYLPIVSFDREGFIAEQDTAELQILSNENSWFADRVEWIAGLYYLDGSTGFKRLPLHVGQTGFLAALPGGQGFQNSLNDLLVMAGLPPLLSGSTDAVAGGIVTSEDLSVYAHGTWFLTDKIDAVIGARYAKVKRGLESSYLGAVDPVNNQDVILLRFSPPELEANQFSPKLALQWRPVEDSMLYLSWSRGFQSPTYNNVNFFGEPDAVDEVRVDTYELGLNSRLFDQALSLEAAIFHSPIKDLLSGFVGLGSGGVVQFQNAGDAEIEGAELSFQWVPMPVRNPGLAFAGGLTYLDGHYKSFPNGEGYDDQSGLAFGEGGVSPLEARDFSGNEIVRTPEWTGTLSINQAFDLPFSMPGNAELGFDVYYNDGFHFTSQNSDLYYQDEYYVLAGRASYFYDPWNLQVTAFGENLADEVYNAGIIPLDTGRHQVLAPPRTYGLRVKWSY